MMLIFPQSTVVDIPYPIYCKIYYVKVLMYLKDAKVLPSASPLYFNIIRACLYDVEFFGKSCEHR